MIMYDYVHLCINIETLRIFVLNILPPPLLCVFLRAFLETRQDFHVFLHVFRGPLFKKHVFYRIINPPATSRHAPGIEPKARQLKENPRPAP